ncbi:DUF2332 domain-containing protein [Silicimonas sp. MF1-12-2]|uniref:DUF2332 domain-containing protein n=1 Tax=Silicimonas sp. MF1-12-2 TaxID=3384793 RepID=UPI0039B60C8D
MTVRDAFRNQASHCAALGSPFMARLMTLAADRLQPGTPVTDRIFSWPGDASANADNVPLRLGGALHALRLQGKALAEVYPPGTPDDDRLWGEIESAMSEHGNTILGWLDNPPQTNEVRRAAVILPALAVLHDAFGLPVELLELGTSGGLNLRADLFRLNLPDVSIGPSDAQVVLSPEWRGGTPPTKLPPIMRRAGVDLSPLDPAKPGDRLRLLAYLWADQPERLTRTRAAIEIARTTPAEISAGDAGEWLECELASPAKDRLRVVLHTVAWQYFPSETRVRAEAAMRSAIGPLARISMEYDGGIGAGVTLTTWPDGVSKQIARADFHGRWVEWMV